MAVVGKFYTPLGRSMDFKPHNPFAPKQGGKPLSPIHPKPHANATKVAEGQRPCPICGNAMRTQSYGLLQMDVCVKHGIWLDKGELRAIGLTRRRKAFDRHMSRAQKKK